MKKRGLSLLTALCLVLALLPAGVLAAESGVVEISSNEQLVAAIANQQDNQTWVFTKAGAYDAANTANNGFYTVPEAEKINGTAGPFVFPIYADNLTIKTQQGLEGQVSVTSSARPAANNGGNWHYQNFITVSGENVAIQDIDLKSNYNEYYEGANKAIEVMEGGKSFQLTNVEILPVASGEDEANGVFSGSIYFNLKDAGSAKLEDVTLYAWVSASQINAGSLQVVDMTQDFRNNVYAGYSYGDWGYAWNPGLTGTYAGITTQGFTVLVDDATHISEQIFNDELRSGTVVKLMPGEYDVTVEGTSIGSGFVVEQDNVVVQAMDPANKPVIYGFSNAAGGVSNGVSGQNTITVSGNGVTLENLKVMPLAGIQSNTNQYQKALEVTAQDTFTMQGCDFVPNSYLYQGETAHNLPEGYAGQVSLNLPQGTVEKVLISGNTFSGAVLDPRTPMTAEHNTFNGVSPVHKMAIRNRLQNSTTGYDTVIRENVFQNIDTANGEVAVYAASSNGQVIAADASNNFWGEGVSEQEIAAMVSGNVSVDSYYTDAEMTQPQPMGGIPVATAAQLQAALKGAKDGDVILVYPGEYDVTPDDVTLVNGQAGWYLPITKSVTLLGVDETGAVITDAADAQAVLYSTTVRPNGSHASQNFITVFADDVTLSGLVIMPKSAVNKTIEVIGKNFTMTDCQIVPNTKLDEPTTSGGSLYFSGSKGTELVQDNYFNKVIVSFDSVAEAESIVIEGNTFDQPQSETTQMISNVTWTNPPTLTMAPVTVVGNEFKDLPEGYDRVILHRMAGTFLVQDNTVTKADGTADERELADMVRFAAGSYESWEDFVAAQPEIVISQDGVTSTLEPAQEENQPPVVTKVLTVTPAQVSDYVNNKIDLTAALEGFEEGAQVSWSVSPAENATLKANGLKATFSASVEGTYMVTATAEGVSATSVITLEKADFSTSHRNAITVSKADNGTVKVSHASAAEGTVVTVTVTANEGYVLDTLTVTANGKELKVTDKGEGKYTFVMPDSKVTVEAAFIAGEDAGSDGFTDVAEDAWYFNAVAYAVEKGFMAGMTETTFAPDAQLTRAQLAQMLYALEGAPEVTGESAFTDVADSAWYAKAVNWAAGEKLVSGYGDGTFGPDDALTREQLTAILYAYAKSEGADMSGKADLSKYTDIDTLSSWAEVSMSWAVDAGLIGGMEDGTLAPAGTATRAQMAQIMMNLLEKVL